MAKAASLSSNHNTTASHVYYDEPAEVTFHSLPVTRIDGAIDRLLGHEQLPQPRITPFRQFVDRTISAIKRQFEPDNLKYNLKCIGIVLAAIAVVILINAFTAGLLTPFFLLLGEVGIILGIELGSFLVSISLFLSIWAAILIVKNNIGTRPNTIPLEGTNATFLRDSHKNNAIPNYARYQQRHRYDHQRREDVVTREKIEIHLLKCIKQLHTQLERFQHKQWSALTENDVETLFGMIKEVDDLSSLATGNHDFDNAKESLIHYLNREITGTPGLQEDGLIQKLRQHAVRVTVIKLNEIRDALENNSPSVDVLEQLNDIFQEYGMQSDVPDCFREVLNEISEQLLNKLPDLHGDLLKYTPKTNQTMALTQGDILEFRNPKNDQNPPTPAGSVPFHVLVDKLHGVALVFNVLNACTAQGSKHAHIPPGQIEILESLNALYADLRPQLSGLKHWAINPVVRKMKRFWGDRHYPVELKYIHLDMLAKNEYDTECPISYESWDEMAPSVHDAGNIVLCLADNKFYRRNHLEVHASRGITTTDDRFVSLPMVACPTNSQPMHILDTYPLSDMINPEDFTLSAILPASLPMRFMPAEHDNGQSGIPSIARSIVSA